MPFATHRSGATEDKSLTSGAALVALLSGCASAQLLGNASEIAYRSKSSPTKTAANSHTPQLWRTSIATRVAAPIWHARTTKSIGWRTCSLLSISSLRTPAPFLPSSTNASARAVLTLVIAVSAEASSASAAI